MAALRRREVLIVLVLLMLVGVGAFSQTRLWHRIRKSLFKSVPGFKPGGLEGSDVVVVIDGAALVRRDGTADEARLAALELGVVGALPHHAMAVLLLWSDCHGLVGEGGMWKHLDIVCAEPGAAAALDKEPAAVPPPRNDLGWWGRAGRVLAEATVRDAMSQTAIPLPPSAAYLVIDSPYFYIHNPLRPAGGLGTKGLFDAGEDVVTFVRDNGRSGDDGNRGPRVGCVSTPDVLLSPHILGASSLTAARQFIAALDAASEGIAAKGNGPAPSIIVDCDALSRTTPMRGSEEGGRGVRVVVGERGVGVGRRARLDGTEGPSGVVVDVAYDPASLEDAAFPQGQPAGTCSGSGAGADAACRARADISSLPPLSCPAEPYVPGADLLHTANPEGIDGVRMAGVEDHTPYPDTGSVPGPLFVDGGSEEACSLFPDSVWCSSAEAARLACPWRRFIQVTECAYVGDNDGHKFVYGMVFDGRRYYPDYPQKVVRPSLSGKTLHEYSELAHALSAYGGTPAHFWTEILPQFLTLNRAVPPHVQILLDTKTAVVRDAVAFLVRRGIITQDRVLPYLGSGHVYYADRVYHHAEMARRPGDVESPFEFDTGEFCFWGTGLPLGEVRSAMVPYPPQQYMRRSIVIIHRRDAYDRMLANEDELVAALKRRFPSRPVVELVVSDHSLSGIIRIVSHAALLIATHGAGMSNMAFLHEGTPIIEIAYRGKGGMPFPPFYFYPKAITLGLKYGCVIGDGDYESPTWVNVGEVVVMADAMLSGNA